MPHKDISKKREYDRQYKRNMRAKMSDEERKAYYKNQVATWRLNNKDKLKAYRQEYRRKHKDKYNKQQRDYYRRKKLAAKSKPPSQISWKF